MFFGRLVGGVGGNEGERSPHRSNFIISHIRDTIYLSVTQLMLNYYCCQIILYSFYFDHTHHIESFQRFLQETRAKQEVCATKQTLRCAAKRSGAARPL